MAQLEQEYLNLKEEKEKQQYLEKLKESEEENTVARVAYNRLTNDKDRVTKQPESSPNPKPNSTKINPNSIPSSVSGEYNKTQNELRPHKTESAIKEGRLSRAQDARLAGQIALQKQKQEQKQVQQVLETEKEIVGKKEQESNKKIVSLIKDTLTQKLDKAA